MPHHDNCADWDYESHPQRYLLVEKCSRLEKVLSRHPKFFDKLKFNTCLAHKVMFFKFAPTQCPEIVGNFRGSNYPCLKTYNVHVPMDPKVGTKPNLVKAEMRRFETQIENAVTNYEKQALRLNSPSHAGILLSRFVGIVAHFLVNFLTIHPFANGNGHTARLLVFVLLSRAGFPPADWTIDAKKNYADALSAHRKGDFVPLTDFLLKAIIG